MGGVSFQSNAGRIVAILLAFAVAFAPAGAVASENCSSWGGGDGFGTLQECLSRRSDLAAGRAEEARKRGDADRSRARNAGLVADKLDSDKGTATRRYNDASLTPELRNQFAQQPYQLQKKYSERYQELSRYSQTSLSKPFPELPTNNRMLMSFDTSPLRKFQKAQQAEAEQLLERSQQAMAAAAQLQNFAGVSGKRSLGIRSLPSSAVISAARPGAARPEVPAAGGGPGNGPRAESSLPAVRIEGLSGNSSISRGNDSMKASSIWNAPQSAGVAVAPGSLLEMHAGTLETEKKNGDPDPAAAAFAKMEKAKLALEQKLSQHEAGMRLKSGAESFLVEVQANSPASAGAGLSAEGGLRPAVSLEAVSLPRELSEAVGAPEDASLAAPPEMVPLETLFAQITRQYRKRQTDLAASRP